MAHLLLDLGGIIFADPWETTVRRLSLNENKLNKVIEAGAKVWTHFDRIRYSKESAFWNMLRADVAETENINLPTNAVLMNLSAEIIAHYNSPLVEALNELPLGSISVASNNVSFFFDAQVKSVPFKKGLIAHYFSSHLMGLTKKEDQFWDTILEECKHDSLLYVDDRKIEIPLRKGIMSMKAPSYPAQSNTTEIIEFLKTHGLF